MASKVEVSKKEKGKATVPAYGDFANHPLLALRSQMDRLFDEFAGDWRLPNLTRNFWDIESSPASLWSRGDVDVCFEVTESDDAIELSAELPGIDEKDVELTLTDGVLTIKGEKKSEKETKEKDYYLSERRYGSFVRSLRLPESIDEGKIKAKFDKGVLNVTLPKRTEAKAKKKKITISRG
ncbi:MAG: Hsp20/alpha crystallin family protein [Alphaproteobacteria bacterium]